GVSTIVGTVDGTCHGAAMFDSMTGRMLGDIWEADDAEDQIEAFLEWLRQLRPVAAVEDGTLELDHAELPFAGDGSDARHWPARGLSKVAAFWRREFTADGLLKELEPAQS